MSSYSAWTPAPQPGLIPLQPMTFGQILGRTFGALRHNPAVLLGFAVVVQAVTSTVAYVLIALCTSWAFTRLETVSPYSDEWGDIAAGSTALAAVAAVVISLLLQCLTVIVQGVVAADVGAGALGEKRTLGALFSRVKPVLGRLIGYTLLFSLASVVAVAVPLAAIVALGFLGGAGIVIAVLLGLVFVVAAIVAAVWISTKLALVPAVIVLEGAGIRPAIRRSWTLTRGRFWPVLGVTFLISIIFSIVGSTVGGVVQLIGSIVAMTAMPLGSTSEADLFITSMLAQLPGAVIQLVVTSVGSVVVATAAAILYIDARMRAEGLDVDLLGYVERRDAGVEPGPDPYAYDPARVRVPAQQYPGQYPPAQQYPGVPEYPYPQQYPAAQQYPGAPQYPAAPQYPPTPPAATPPPAAPFGETR